MLFRISKFFLYASIFSVIFVTPSTLFPFIVGKYAFFRMCVDFALILFLIGLLIDERAKEKEERIRKVLKHPLVLAVGIFVLAYVIAGVAGIEPSFSFWSNFERGEGGFQIIHFFVLFVLFATLFSEEREWRNVFIAWTLASFFVIFYGLFAMAGVNGFIGGDGSGIHFGYRFQGSLGNSDYTGSYFIFSFVFALLLFFLGRKRKMGFGVSLLLVAPIIFFWWSQTRGAFVGATLAFFAFLIFLIRKSESAKLKKVLAGTLLVVILFGGVLYVNRKTPLVQSIPGARLLDISLSSGQPRLWAWESAFQGWRERPIFGWGPENFIGAFNKYFDARHYNPKTGGETWFDRAHSIYLDYLVSTGIVGFLAFLGIFVTFYVMFFRSGYAQAKDRSLVERGLLFSLPIFYLGQGITLFEVLPIYLGWFVFLSYALQRFQVAANSKHKGNKNI